MILGLKPRVLTWHVHGSYLYYLTHTDCIFYLPTKNDDSPGYGGKRGSFKWGANVVEVPVEEVKDLKTIDCVLFQSQENFLKDQYQILSEEQRSLPQIYLEHDPPRESPTETVHVTRGSEATVVQVTHFNKLMWDNGDSPVEVIEHGAPASGISYRGDKAKGIVIVNNLAARGRRLGGDIFERVRKTIPLDLIGMGSEKNGGLGEIDHNKLGEFISHYRFLFNPIRYTSLGLAVIEAMEVGLPVIGLATTEMSTAVINGVNGWVDTNVEILIDKMAQLLQSQKLAQKWSLGAKMIADRRFNIDRFIRDWEDLFVRLCRGIPLYPPKKEETRRWQKWQ